MAKKIRKKKRSGPAQRIGALRYDRAYRVVLNRNDKGGTWFNVMHRNGKVITTSENYARPGTALRIAKALAVSAGWDVWERVNPKYGPIWKGK